MLALYIARQNFHDHLSLMGDLLRITMHSPQTSLMNDAGFSQCWVKRKFSPISNRKLISTQVIQLTYTLGIKYFFPLKPLTSIFSDDHFKFVVNKFQLFYDHKYQHLLMKEAGLSAVIFAATGAVGSTLLRLLLASEKWSRVHCVVRKQPEEWSKLSNKHKLSIQVEADMDKLFKTEEWNLKGFDNMFVSFGVQRKQGEEMLRKVDKTYPLLCADIALRNNIPHYHLVSSIGADETSVFIYMQLKGEVERELKQKKLHMLSIYQPGLIKNRPNERIVEKISAFVCCLPAIECSDLALSMMLNGEKYADVAHTASNVHHTYSNQDMLDLVQNK